MHSILCLHRHSQHIYSIIDVMDMIKSMFKFTSFMVSVFSGTWNLILCTPVSLVWFSLANMM